MNEADLRVRRNSVPENLRCVDAVLREEIERTLALGVKQWFIRKVAGVSETTMSKARKPGYMMFVVTHGKILEACIKIQQGEVEIPSEARWKPKRKKGREKPKACQRGHLFTGMNLMYTSRGYRQCKACLRDSQRRYAQRYYEKNREAVRERQRQRTRKAA